MNFTRWTAVAILAAMLHLHAQTSAPTQSPAPAAAPTMDQTVEFNNGIFNGTGSFSSQGGSEVLSQRVTVDSSCILLYQETWRIEGESPLGKGIAQVYLGKANPMSLQVAHIEDTWHITVEQPGSHSHYDQNHKLNPSYIDPKPEIGEFPNSEAAQKVAKAYIHAMVLCHKPEAPSPF